MNSKLIEGVNGNRLKRPIDRWVTYHPEEEEEEVEGEIDKKASITGNLIRNWFHGKEEIIILIVSVTDLPFLFHLTWQYTKVNVS